MTTSQRKQYAKRCFIEGRTNTRGFDNCFEEKDADDVVRYLMQQATLSETEKAFYQEWKARGRWIVGDAEWKKARAIESRLKLQQAIKADGKLWENWTYFIETGRIKEHEAA